jgi:hypothetical protein
MIGLAGVLAITTMAACGGDDNSGGGDGGSVSAEARPYVDALKKSMTASDEEGDLTLTNQQADCVAPKWINSIGVAKLKAKGVKPEDIGANGSGDLTDLQLSQDQGNQLYDAFGQCNVQIKSVFIKSMNPSMTSTDEKCLNDNFDDALMRQFVVATLTKGADAIQNDQDLFGKVLGVFSKCPGAIPNS